MKQQTCILSSILTSYSLDPLPKSGMAHSRMPADHLSGVKHMPVVARGSAIYPQSQIPDICYDTRLPPSGPQYEPPQFSTGMFFRIYVEKYFRESIW